MQAATAATRRLSLLCVLSTTRATALGAGRRLAAGIGCLGRRQADLPRWCPGRLTSAAAGEPAGRDRRSVREDDPALVRALADGQHGSAAGGGHGTEEADAGRGGDDAPVGAVPVLGERPLEL